MAKEVKKDAKKDTKKDTKKTKNDKSYLKDFRLEMKKVTWPTLKQVVNNTIAVITIVLILSAIIFLLDLVFAKLSDVANIGVQKIQEVVSSDEETSETEATPAENTEGETTTENAVEGDTVEITDTNAATENVVTTEATTETAPVAESTTDTNAETTEVSE